MGIFNKEDLKVLGYIALTTLALTYATLFAVTREPNPTKQYEKILEIQEKATRNLNQNKLENSLNQE